MDVDLEIRRKVKNMQTVLARYERTGKPEAWKAQLRAAIVHMRETGMYLPAGTRWAEGVPCPKDLEAAQRPASTRIAAPAAGAGLPAVTEAERADLTRLTALERAVATMGVGGVTMGALLARIEALERKINLRFCAANTCAGTLDEPSDDNKCPFCYRWWCDDCFNDADFLAHDSDNEDCPEKGRETDLPALIACGGCDKNRKMLGYVMPTCCGVVPEAAPEAAAPEAAAPEAAHEAAAPAAPAETEK
jgi:hypothetical protein